MKRLEYIDIAKGVGIILVVLGHCVSTETSLGRWIYSFHMPLFFFISGFCFNNKKYNDFIFFSKMRFKQIIIPYVYFALLLIILQSIINKDGNFIFTFWDGFTNFINTGSLGALWFLPVLFISEMLYFFIQKIRIRTIQLYIQILILIVFSLVGLLLFKEKIELPYALTTIFSATVFYGAGNLLSSKIQIILDKIQIRSLVIGIVLLFPITIAFSILINPALNMNGNRFDPLLFTYLGAFIGISLVFLCSYFLNKNKVLNDYINSGLTFLGMNTLVILAFHMFFIEVSSKFVKPLITNFLFYKGSEQIFIWCAILITIYFINTYFPWIIGKKKSKLQV